MSKQIELIRKFDAEASYMLDGTAAVMHVGGLTGKLNELRRGREQNRPPVVTLEPTRNGLMLGLKVSRPVAGRLAYDQVLGHWDLTVPVRRGGPLNEAKPRHRRAAAWGLQLLSVLLDTARRLRAGTGGLAELTMPRVFIPFEPGKAVVDASKQAMFPDAAVDYQNDAGKELVDARIAKDADVARAINDNTALEDFLPVLGQRVANPFYGVQIIRMEARELSVAEIKVGASAAVFSQVRKFLGRGIESGATDQDIVAAVENPDADMTLSMFSRVQVVPVESLHELPAPYAGSLLPPVNWRVSKNYATIN
jgi:hypothetical protein